MRSGPFDLKKLSQRIDDARVDRKLTWAAISAEVGVATSTIRRYATANDAEADGVLALIGWLGLSPEEFITDSNVAGAPLPSRGDGVIRVDMKLVAELQSPPESVRPSTRTTIQRLASVAQASGVPIGSLTRWSPV